MTTLDLHGMYHDTVERNVENFILMNETPMKIITGNSLRMKELVFQILERHDFGYYPVTVELLGFNGCLTVIVDSLFIGNNPQIGSANPGNTDGICGPSDLTFPVLNFSANDPSTVYWVELQK
mgnify:CR=1 FL=1